MSSEEDIKAKEAARASRSNQPGAVSVASEEASRFDQRISEKLGDDEAAAAPGRTRKLESMESDGMAKQAASTATPASKPGAVEAPGGVLALDQLERDLSAKANGPSSAPRQLEDMEAELLAKRQGMATAPATSPGAVAATSNSLESLESDVVAKQQAAGAQPLSQMEQDILQKQRGSPASFPGVVASGSSLSQLEQDVVAKQGGGSVVVGAAVPGALAVTQLEQDIAAKSGAVTGGTQSGLGAQSGLSSLEDAVVAKSNSQPARSGRSGLASLEDAIARKNQREPSAASTNLDALESSVAQKNISGGIIAGGMAATSTGDGGFTTTDLGQMEADVIAKNGGAPNGDSPLMKAGEDMKDPEPEQAPPKHEDGPDVEYGVFDPEDEGGLAVALPVAEEEDPYIQSAVEYDPDAKPPIYRRRRFRLYAFLGFFALVAVAVGAVIGIVLSGNSSSSDDAEAEEDPVRVRIERLVGAEALDDPGSPYEQAYLWMKYNDTLGVEPNDPNFVQRFALVSFYYATTVDEPWNTCNPPEDDEEDNCIYRHLVGLPSSYQDFPWIRWLTPTKECEWAGIYCDDDSNQLRAIELHGNNLNGEWPESLKLLPFLQSISLPWGSLSGPLPADVAELDHLVSIEAQYNDWTGPIPREWFESRQLVRLNLAGCKLSGTIPPSVGQAKDLRALYLQSNDITGQIPPEIGQATNLAFLYLNKNALTGTIPETISDMSSLERFYVQKNDLNGTLPMKMGDCTNLLDIRVHQQLNGNLAGDIPESLYTLEKLFRLDIRDNKFTGSLSSRVGDLESLIELRLAGNRMTGVLPSSVGDLLALRTLDFQGALMNITGSIPTQMCERRGALGLQTLSANCKADATGFLEVECAEECACTCCDPEGMDCD